MCKISKLYISGESIKIKRTEDGTPLMIAHLGSFKVNFLDLDFNPPTET